ncbi:TerB family tellurite resistance protein [Pseudodesulfovibrio sp. zrk46]|uniref:TerB family tellurite resistance protein n=1 Tax=Pseudodesulfovibrio sp. zrk46 TaxID=2725288 RepID=UPI00144926EF|nr:TerB family tellurite resistance protein [Pseudodesulfovibrio sp. zrk46]QJB57530.1 tellurite resistance TerB family protein [Pseudodesulfovibrio sp. zrk46]
MLDTLSQPEAVCILCLLMVGADDEVKMEEISSMLNNPFFKEHVTQKIGSHRKFLKRFKKAKAEVGAKALEQKAITVIKTTFPAFQLKLLALLTLIAGADNNYDQQEKELIARIATNLGVSIEDVQPELEKMREAILNMPIRDDDSTSNGDPS